MERSRSIEKLAFPTKILSVEARSQTIDKLGGWIYNSVPQCHSRKGAEKEEKMRMIKIPVLCLLLFTFGQAANAFVVQSTFDAGLEGWTSNIPAEISYASTGGNPGGYIRFEDFSGYRTYLIAPAKFLGDWSTLDEQGILCYDHKVFQTGTYDEAIPYEVTIRGPSGSANWKGATPTGQTGWVIQVVPIRQEAWTVLSGTWSGLLSDVDTLEITIEQFSNPSTPFDTCGIDNIELLPEPSSLLALLCGLGGAGGSILRLKR